MTYTAVQGRLVDRLLAEYGVSHRNGTNKLIHWFAVPMIVWTVIALLWSIPVPSAFAAVPYLNWCTIALLLTIIYYFYLSAPLAIGMILYCLIAIVLTAWYDANGPTPLWQLALAVFVVAWVAQFIGHHIEGRKPSFFKDVQFLLIGPAWLLHFLYRKLGIAY